MDLLLLALAPDLDSRFERLYGYLNDDVTRRRATIGLGLELCGASPWWAEARGVLSAEAPLLTADLLVVEEPERPYLTRSLRVPDRVAAHLLGDDRPDPTVAELLRPDVTLPAHDGVRPLAAAIAQGAELVYLRERPGSSTPALAAAALREAGLPALVVDLDHLGSARRRRRGGQARRPGGTADRGGRGRRPARGGARPGPRWRSGPWRSCPGRCCCTAGPGGNRRGAGGCR